MKKGARNLAQDFSSELKRTTVAILVVMAIVLTIVLGVLVYSGRSTDKVSRDNETELVSRFLDNALRRVGDEIAIGSVYNEAYRHSHTSDVAWLKSNLTDFFASYAQHNITVIFDGQRKPFMASRDSQLVKPEAESAFIAAIAPMLEAVQGETAQKRRTLDGKVATGFDLLSTRISVVKVEGEFYLAGVSTIVAADTVEPVLPGPDTLAASGRRLSSILDTMPATLAIDAPSIAPAGANVVPGVKFYGPDHQELGVITWRPKTPGAGMLGHAAPYIVFAILALACAAFVLHRRVLHILRRLERSNKALTDAQQAVRILLDNADQGFLTIGADLVADEQSSAACAAIFGQAPAGKPLIGLLNREAHEAAAMRATIESVFNSSDDFSRDLKIELLPTEFDLGGKIATVSYKFLADSNKLMLILTDVTQARAFAESVERERQRLEMIVLAVTEGQAFTRLVNDYREFLSKELPALIERIEAHGAMAELRRRLHTHKGLLAQFSFHRAPRGLNEAETRLEERPTWTPDAAEVALNIIRLRADFDADLDIVSDVLSADSAMSGRRRFLSQRHLAAMEQTAQTILAGDEGRRASPPLRLLLQTLAGLGSLDVKAALALHARGAAPLAARLEKELAAVRVTGDDVGLPPGRYDEFLRSLVHVFRNAVDHGIEDPEQRVLAGKPPQGSIVCDVQRRAEAIEISISDDGAGIDRAALENKLEAAGEPRPSVQALSLEQLVCWDGLSSRSSASDISGRGVGLAAVKAELDLIGGSVEVVTKLGAGSCFCFRLPVGCNEDSTPDTSITAERIAS